MRIIWKLLNFRYIAFQEGLTFWNIPNWNNGPIIGNRGSIFLCIACHITWDVTNHFYGNYRSISLFISPFLIAYRISINVTGM